MQLPENMWDRLYTALMHISSLVTVSAGEGRKLIQLDKSCYEVMILWDYVVKL
jgi:hypothetical protein